jgi:hypothetical protein
VHLASREPGRHLNWVVVGIVLGEVGGAGVGHLGSREPG